ncbi:hypothetical protein [Microvirus mar39]|uniref:Uncharacterized protein n=1 Tax=Microvirus mar39 TaxID=2851173 RepID=A0A8F5MJ22_9VIRU|nr:hypothetical protein [Microvirus mar39]
MNKILKWLLRKVYKEECKIWLETCRNQKNQIENLKQRLKYMQQKNIFNFEERKYHNEHL